MATKKAVASRIRLIINAGLAKPAPPVGPALGQAGLNIMAFCKEFNAKTTQFKDTVPLRVYVKVYADKTYDWHLKMPPATWLIKQATGVVRAADRPGHEVAGVISLKHVYEIAKVKQRDLPQCPLELICRQLLWTCRSMGIRVVPRPEDA